MVTTRSSKRARDSCWQLYESEASRVDAPRVPTAAVSKTPSCPICMLAYLDRVDRDDGMDVCVPTCLPCGHSLCVPCVDAMVKCEVKNFHDEGCRFKPPTILPCGGWSKQAISVDIAWRIKCPECRGISTTAFHITYLGSSYDIQVYQLPRNIALIKLIEDTR